MGDLQKLVGKNLQALILAQYRTIELFAHEHDLSKGWLSQIIAGKRDPKISSVIRLAEALDVPLTDIYPGKKK